MSIPFTIPHPLSVSFSLDLPLCLGFESLKIIALQHSPPLGAYRARQGLLSAHGACTTTPSSAWRLACCFRLVIPPSPHLPHLAHHLHLAPGSHQVHETFLCECSCLLCYPSTGKKAWMRTLLICATFFLHSIDFPQLPATLASLQNVFQFNASTFFSTNCV